MICIGSVIGPVAATAQSIDILFPKGLYGYDQQLGVTVLTRDRSAYDPLGIQLGSFLIRPSVDESLFYNSNVNANGASGSWGSHTAASLSAASGWTRDSLNASVGVANTRFFSLPTENYTDWNIGISGGYTISDSQLIAAYSHQSYHQLSTNIGSAQSDVPILYQTDSARLEYTFNFGRVAITPDLSFSAYRFGPARIADAQISEDFLNNDVLAVGNTTRYAINSESGVLVVFRGLNTSYISPQTGQPSNDSNSFQLLSGIDYQSKGVWRYRLLAGVEIRAFAASQYGTRTAPDIEGSVIWSPTSLTTLTGTLSNSIQSPQIAGTSSYVLTQAHLVADHEYERNVLVSGRAGFQYAQYAQIGTQNNITVGAGITWLLNRDVKLSLTYDFTEQSGIGNATAAHTPVSATAGGYDQHLVALTLHLAL